MNKIRRFILICMTAVAVFSAATFGIHAESKHIITVSPGDGTIAVADELESEGLIKSKIVFRLKCRREGVDGKWQPGEFELADDEADFENIVDKLTTPQTKPVRVTIPEGWQVKQIAAEFESKGVCDAKDFMAACDEVYDGYDFINDVDTGDRINGRYEGYLFPDTYYFDESEDPGDVVRTMLDDFRSRVYTDENIRAASDIGYSFDDVIILASMVESEAQTEQDRRLVADVFMRRLESPDYPNLQSCVTVEYAMGIKKQVISLEDTEFESPYNTYKYEGLPAGPICCPGLESINAVLHPEPNDYFYFVSDDKCDLHFAVTAEEHAANAERIWN